MPDASQYPRYYSRKFEELRKEFGGVCQHDGCTETRVEFAHIVTTAVNGRGRGQAVRYYDIRSHRERFKLLCRKHHLEFDLNEGPKLPDEVPF